MPAANSRAHMLWGRVERHGTRLSCRSGAALQIVMQNWVKADGSAPERWLTHGLVGNRSERAQPSRSVFLPARVAGQTLPFGATYLPVLSQADNLNGS